MKWFVASTWRLGLIFNTSVLVIALSDLSVLSQPQIQKQQADDYLTQAEVNLSRNSLSTAKNNFQQALKIYQTIGDTTGQKDALIGLSKIDYQQARYDQALIYLRQAAKYNSQPDGKLLSTRGLIYLELGDYYEAVQDLKLGNHYLRVSGNFSPSNRKEIEQVAIALGEAYFYLGQYQQALDTLQSNINRTSDLHLKRRAYNAIGTVQLELGQPEIAKVSFEQALNVPNIPGDRVGKAQTLENLGKAAQALGDRRQSLKYYQQALAQLQALGAWGQQVFVLNKLGVLAEELSLDNRALEYLQTAEGTLSSSGGAGRVITLINLGNYYYKKGDYQTAKEYLNNALNWARSNGDRIGETKALSSLGAIELQSNNITEAITYLEDSLQVFESLRPGLPDEAKISLFDTQVNTYSLLQKAYVTQQEIESALIIAERGRARAFIELLAQRQSDKILQNNQVAPPTIAEIQQAASDRNSTLITYSIITNNSGEETALYMWVIDPRGNIRFRQLDLTIISQQYSFTVADSNSNYQSDLENLVIAIRGNTSQLNSQLVPTTVNNRSGYEIFIQPIADLLPTNPEEKIILIPQGSIFLVPFAALENTDGKFLIQNHTIQIAPSIQTLTLKKSVSTNSNKHLVIGNPEPMPADLLPLPGTEKEAIAVAQILNTNALLNTAATETTIKEQMAQAGIIHFATHGLYNDKQGMTSSLALSATDGDGFLTAAEIIDLDLQAELVVLSACNTGRGKITGDGIIGLSRSFLAAGAQSTISSLWYVPDLPTASLMTEFYKNLEANKDKAQALRQAMLTTMEEHPHPLNWASFFLIE